ncbi:hypothetical protein GTQ34_01235 [Muricauda sp. JGD-17]|uniref:Uncharacterized protein n=1 Tax=Flagellimonas ochracea TaxID=2696472 RepID=A0A964T956_9FLAO|nr:hypothetical protein [Allomuricauda ochracea]NAY90527.1 hypothetical protein [Allomuricauda ochracea]
MKTFFILILSLMAIPHGEVEQDSILYATYQGHDSQMYLFEDDEGETHEFATIRGSASKKYNMDSDDHVGKMFKVVYTIESEEEGDTYIILDLELPM